MRKALLNLWVSRTAIGLALWAAGVVPGLMGVSVCRAQQGTSYGGNLQAAPPAGGRSFTQSITSGVKSGIDRIGNAVRRDPPVRAPEDAISLHTKASAGPDLYVRVARLYEQSGKISQAAEQYRKALELKQDYLGALLGYARLLDRMNNPAEALRLYQRATATHPNRPVVYYNLGLFQARRGQLVEALPSLERAIKLQPNNPQYRNNMAIVLVEMGRSSEAFVQLKAAHSEPVAFYNLGFLLEKHGDLALAAQYFQMALQKDPSLAQARLGLNRLAAARSRGPMPLTPSGDPRLGSRTNRPDAALPPSGVYGGEVRQLPPVPRSSPPGAAPLPPPAAPSGPAFPAPGTPPPAVSEVPRRLPPIVIPPSSPPAGDYRGQSLPSAPMPAPPSRF